jgi:small subunit ribosomal protein S2
VAWAWQGKYFVGPPVGKGFPQSDGRAEAQTGKGILDMALPEFTMRQLLEAGVHYGHQTARWNPKMGEYIYGDRNGIHILDLTQTLPLLEQALTVVRDTVAKGGRILFVGTKRQAQKPIAEAAEKSAQFFMNHRWLGGTLTNWQTVSKSILRLKQIDELLENGAEGLTKKERLHLEREQGKLQASLGGIREMGSTPDLLFVVDVGKESLAILEAKKLGIPVIGIVDTNCSPKDISYVIPGNDDAARSIGLYCDLISRAALEGMSAQMGAAGVDLGALEQAPEEDVLAEEATAKAEI